MIVFADASALIAIVAHEPDAVPIAYALEAAETRFCSALALWESAAGLCRNYKFTPAAARERLDLLRSRLGIQIVGIGEREYDLALDAYARFGKGRHPAALNLGDCFAYACTKTSGAAILCKGGDFSKTDIRLVEITPIS